MYLRQQQHRFFTDIIFALLLMMSCSLVQADIVDLTIFGETTSSSGTNDFGLGVGDKVSLKASFDLSSLSGSGTEKIGFTGGSKNILSLFMGNYTFTTDNNTDFFLGFPVITFFDGSFSGIDYLAYSERSDQAINLNSLGNRWASTIVTNTNQQQLSKSAPQWITGIWDDDTLTIADMPDIPEPGPFALATIGILGAWIASKRRKTLS